MVRPLPLARPVPQSAGATPDKTRFPEAFVKSSTLLCLLAAVAAASLGAQEPDRVSMDRLRAEEAIERFNAPSTIRFFGRSGVPEGGVVTGDVAVLGGPFEVGGLIDGDLLVLNGNVELSPGGRILGDLTVIGGRVLGPTDGAIAGELAVFPRVVRVVERDGLVALSARQLRDYARQEGMGRAFVTFRAGTNYNRVEGLPVIFGPVFETADPLSLKIEALAIWRTESGLTLDSEELGYNLLVEQRFGRSRAFSLGGTLHSDIQPISYLGLSDLESSLATFFLRKDYRDYFDRKGWSAFATAWLPDLPISLRVELADEDHQFAPVQSPWTLRHNDDPWRPQPLVAEGDLQTLTGEIALDTRNDADDPTDGWWVRARAVQGLDGALQIREHASIDPLFPLETIEAGPVDEHFTAGTLDLRRYARVGPDADVSLRLFAAGALGDVPLPPQYQHALGGEGTLPGYLLFQQDCGARVRPFAIRRADADSTVVERVFPRYGCDRAALAQFEFRRRVGFDVHVSDDDDDRKWYPSTNFAAAWSVFFDVGRGWSLTDPELDTPWVSDLGLGLFLGDVGLYVAYPLRGEERDLNFFIRFDRRF
jgi:hypothetical protein